MREELCVGAATENLYHPLPVLICIVLLGPGG